MKNQFKLFVTSVALLVAAGAAVSTAQADATAPLQSHSARAALIHYMALVGEQNSQALSPLNLI